MKVIRLFFLLGILFVSGVSYGKFVAYATYTTNINVRVMAPADKMIAVSTPKGLASLMPLFFGIDKSGVYYADSYNTQIRAVLEGTPQEVFELTDGVTTGVGLGVIQWKPTKSGTYTFQRTFISNDGSGETLGSDESFYTVTVNEAALVVPKISVVSVKQRYPWNGIVDVRYVISGLESDQRYAVHFKFVAAGTTRTFDVEDVAMGEATANFDLGAASAFGSLNLEKAPATVTAQVYCIGDAQ